MPNYVFHYVTFPSHVLVTWHFHLDRSESRMNIWVMLSQHAFTHSLAYWANVLDGEVQYVYFEKLHQVILLHLSVS